MISRNQNLTTLSIVDLGIPDWIFLENQFSKNQNVQRGLFSFWYKGPNLGPSIQFWPKKHMQRLPERFLK